MGNIKMKWIPKMLLLKLNAFSLKGLCHTKAPTYNLLRTACLLYQ